MYQFLYVLYIVYVYSYIWASLLAQMLESPPPMQETQVWSLGWNDPLEKEMAIYSSILAWEIPQTEEPVQSTGSQKSQTQLRD